MDQGRASVSYAKALLDWSYENNRAKDVYVQSFCLINLIKSNPDFSRLLHSPMASLSKKVEAIKHVLNSCSPLLANFTALMVKNHREKQIINALLVYQTQYRQKYNTVNAIVESAVEMNSSSKQKTKDYLTGKYKKEIELEFLVNPELIGGFIITVDNNLMDKSVKGEIAKIRRKLIGIET